MKSVEDQAREILGADTFTIDMPEIATKEEMAAENVEIEIVPEPQKPVARPEPIALASINTNMQIISSQAAAPLAIIPKPVHAKAKEIVMETTKSGQIEVMQGMTWYQISREHKIKTDSLKSWNPEQAGGLQVGKKIWVRRPVSEAFNRISEPKAVVKQADPSEFYEVKPGDTAFKIAQKFGLKVDDMLRLNGKDAAALSIGEKLRVK